MFRLIPLFFLFLWPFIHVIFSARVQGDAKYGWAILTLLFSWLAYPFFLYKTKK